MKKYLFAFSALTLSTSVMAQFQPNVINVDMSSILKYLIPFYIITMFSLGWFLMKLVRPSLIMWPLYLSALIGIGGAALVTYGFKNIQEEQLPQVTGQFDATDENVQKMTFDDLSEYSQHLVRQREKEVNAQHFANFWIIATPNFFVLILGFYTDRRMKKTKGNTKRRSRYR